MKKISNQKWLKTKVVGMLLLQLFTYSAIAQYAPPAGSLGTTAIHQDSAVFVSWANSCTIELGPMDATGSVSGTPSVGTEESVIGKADGLGVVSLGDGGSAIVQFDPPIINGVGPDFAVFENSFSDDFLELAFVEVSSDGVNFVRFPSVSLTDTTQQIDTYGTLDATKINNLAGKYRAAYGTPFDLEELKDSAGLNVNSITHVKIIDVVGSVNSVYASHDKNGRAINDPWPTPFESSGFDLDAVGGINVQPFSVEKQLYDNKILVYPNPCRGEIKLLGELEKVNSAELMNLSGSTIKRFDEIGGWRVDDVQNGIYVLKLQFKVGVVYKKVVIKNE